MRAIVEPSAVFAGLSGDDSVRPDAAVAHVEQLAAILKALTDTDRRVLVEFIGSMADAEQRESGPTERSEFLRSLAENPGLVDAR